MTIVTGYQLFMCLKNLSNESLKNFPVIVNIVRIFPDIASYKKEFLRGENILDIVSDTDGFGESWSVMDSL